MTDCVYIYVTHFLVYFISIRLGNKELKMTAVFKLFLKTGIKTRTMYRKATELLNKRNKNVVNCVFLCINPLFSIFFR